MTQKELILKWISEHGYIIPAKISGRVYYETMFGSETSKRCREMRKMGELESQPDPDNPKFERFFFPKYNTHSKAVDIINSESKRMRLEKPKVIQNNLF